MDTKKLTFSQLLLMKGINSPLNSPAAGLPSLVGTWKIQHIGTPYLNSVRQAYFHRYTLLYCEDSVRSYVFKLLQNNLTFPNNMWIKGLMHPVYIFGVWRHGSLEVRGKKSRWQPPDASCSMFISVRHFPHLTRPLTLNKNSDNSMRLWCQNFQSKCRKNSQNIWHFAH